MTQCAICHGDGKFYDFRCPFCRSNRFGSVSSGDHLRRYCAECHFSWMDYEDFRYFIKTEYNCLACMGTGQMIVWGVNDGQAHSD